MSLDDRQFRPDGTLITWIDIQILKQARFLTYLLTRDGEETIHEAKKRVYLVASIIMLISALLLLLNHSYLEGFFTLYFYNQARLKRKGKRRDAFYGKGTNIPTVFKYVMIIALLFIPFYLWLMSSLPSTDNAVFPIPAFIVGKVFAVGYFLYWLVSGYIERLGDIPPKKKKVKEAKLALAENR